jgi:hypothetical protein
MDSYTGFCVFVKDFTGKYHTIDVNPEVDTIGDIKKIFENLTGYKSGFRYIYAGKQLYDDSIKVIEYKIQNQSVIQVVGRLLSCIKCSS